MPIFSRLLQNALENTDTPKIIFVSNKSSKKGTSKHKKSNKKNTNKTEMSKSEIIYDIAKEIQVPNTKMSKSEIIYDNAKEIQDPNNKMSNSEIIYEIAKEIQDPTECPSTITREMLLKELDCEDLRSREEKKPRSVKKKELWAAYVNINMHIFSKYNPPKQNHKSIATLMRAK